ncbi:hypothetical protein BAU67_001856 [Escherichia coli]|nr:hypothetical protein [Escherichia coli]
MKELTLGFKGRSEFEDLMEEIGFATDEDLQQKVLVEVVGFIYKETDQTYEEEDEFGNAVSYPVVVRSDMFYVDLLILDQSAVDVVTKWGTVIEDPGRPNRFSTPAVTLEE